MLVELGGVSKIIIAVGYTDLRLRINGLAQVVGSKYDLKTEDKISKLLDSGKAIKVVTEKVLYLGTIS